MRDRLQKGVQIASFSKKKRFFSCLLDILDIIIKTLVISFIEHTANILTLLSTAFGSVTCATVILLYLLQPKIAIDLKLYSSMSQIVMGTAVVCDNHCQITVTQPITLNWLQIFAVDF